MTDPNPNSDSTNPNGTNPSGTNLDLETDPDAHHFAQVTSGIYRRVEPEAVWLAVRYAVGQRLAAENPTIMMMFVRIAEVYSEVRGFLQSCVSSANDEEQSALRLILDPPNGIRNAEYLPDQIESPGEMDLCWSEFLVTGSTEPIEKVMAVLDRQDLSREIVDGLLQSDDSAALQLDDSQRGQLAGFGIALGCTDEKWRIASPGDIDLLLWFGLKDQNPTCALIANQMTQEQLVHLATKGAALWSLRANAGQHGKIRMFCEEQAKVDGGIGRLLIIPPV